MTYLTFLATPSEVLDRTGLTQDERICLNKSYSSCLKAANQICDESFLAKMAYSETCSDKAREDCKRSPDLSCLAGDVTQIQHEINKCLPMDKRSQYMFWGMFFQVLLQWGMTRCVPFNRFYSSVLFAYVGVICYSLVCYFGALLKGQRDEMALYWMASLVILAVALVKVVTRRRENQAKLKKE